MANVIEFDNNQVGCSSQATSIQHQDNSNNKSIRYFIDFICDAGVYHADSNFTTVVEDETTDDDTANTTLHPRREELIGEYPRVVFRLGSFHIFKNFLELVLKVIRIFEPRELLDLCDYDTIPSQEFLLHGTNIRRSFDWIHDCFIPALMESLVQSFYDFRTEATISLSDYIKIGCEIDVTFRNYCCLLFDTLLPLVLLKTSIRTSNMVAFDCARLKLLPLCFSLHNTTYGPRHVKEIVLLYHRIHQDVLRHYSAHFSFDGKGFDERLEEHNKDVLSMLSDNVPTRKSIITASLFLEQCECFENILENTLKFNKNQNPNRKKEEKEEVTLLQQDRTHENQRRFVTVMKQAIIKREIFTFIHRRDYCITFMETIMKSELLYMENIFSYGKQHMKQWTAAFVHGDKPPKFAKSVLAEEDDDVDDEEEGEEEE